MFIKHYFIYSLLGIFPVNNENVNREYAILFILQKKIFLIPSFGNDVKPIFGKVLLSENQFSDNRVVTNHSRLISEHLGKLQCFLSKIFKNSNIGR